MRNFKTCVLGKRVDFSADGRLLSHRFQAIVVGLYELLD